MLQLGARYYWPEVGRFLQQDPIGSGVNWYIYGASNPVAHIDPTGEVLDYAWDACVLAYDAYQYEKDPSDENQAALAVDAGLAVTPFAVAGVGPATKAGRFAKGKWGAAKAALRSVARRFHHPLPPHVLKQLGVPAKKAGRLHQEQVKIPHINVGDWHVSINRHNWYNPRKWAAKAKPRLRKKGPSECQK